MASYRESHTSRPQSQHRPSTSSLASSAMPIRHTAPRHHAHSVSLGALNSFHRVSRRKSMTSSTNNNMAALVAAIEGSEGNGSANSMKAHRRSLGLLNEPSRQTADRPSINDGLGASGQGYTRNDSYQYQGATYDRPGGFHSSAILDDDLLPGETPSNTKPRGRRASEGTHLSKSEAKRASGELKCDKCGKGYKHSSCLTKHLWEHTPQWALTSKLLISKHQQVQLLEAASVLVGMNQDEPAATDAGKPNDSDHSSASPAASGTSEIQDDFLSSAETTPPPSGEGPYTGESFRTARPESNSGVSSLFSRSYQSAPSSSLPRDSAAAMGSFYGRSRSPARRRRPSSSSYGSPTYFAADDDTTSLAAAVELVNFGTPSSRPVHLPPDVPPVPPLPARYVEEYNTGPPTSSLNPGSLFGVHTDLGIPSLSTQTLSNERGAPEEFQTQVKAEQRPQSMQPVRHYDEDEGVFGQMEE